MMAGLLGWLLLVLVVGLSIVGSTALFSWVFTEDPLMLWCYLRGWRRIAVRDADEEYANGWHHTGERRTIRPGAYLHGCRVRRVKVTPWETTYWGRIPYQTRDIRTVYRFRET